MGKGSRKAAKAAGNESASATRVKSAVLADDKAVDPSLALLFASSAGPVQAPPKARYERPATQPDGVPGGNSAGSDGEEELSSVDGDLEDVDIDQLSDASEEADQSDEPTEDLNLDHLIEASAIKPERSRKRKATDEDLEGMYMQKLAKQDEKEEEERQAERRVKRQRLLAEEGQDISEAEDATDEDSEDTPERVIKAIPSDAPLHESLDPSEGAAELEKASRTVFLANVSTLAISSKSAKRDLLAHLASFFAEIPEAVEGKPAHKVESIRFRSTAYAGTALPKKAAFAKKDLMAATTKSTNAYAVYSSAFAAREAVKQLNGTTVLDRHLRVDGVAHPAKTDHRRCVFVGNLGFVDDESMLDQGGENERKRSKIPSDVEEGLWRQFGKAGTVESVRVVRDEKTRVGKGFAYVQFHDPNAVEAALLFNEKKYPPMLPRILRVVRAKAIRKTGLGAQIDPKSGRFSNKPRIYNPKLSSNASSLQGRAGKLLGKAGAAQIKKKEGSGANTTEVGKRGQGGAGEGTRLDGISKTPEHIVFEGYRASAKGGKPRGSSKAGGGGSKNKGKPRTRSTKRASDWRKTAGKKGKD